MLGGIDIDLVALAQDLPGKRIEFGDLFDFITPELDADRQLLVRGHDLERVAAHAEAAARHVEIVPLVLHIDKFVNNAAASPLVTLPHGQHEALVLLGRSQAVDA